MSRPITCELSAYQVEALQILRLFQVGDLPRPMFCYIYDFNPWEKERSFRVFTPRAFIEIDLVGRIMPDTPVDEQFTALRDRGLVDEMAIPPFSVIRRQCVNGRTEWIQYPRSDGAIVEYRTSKETEQLDRGSWPGQELFAAVHVDGRYVGIWPTPRHFVQPPLGIWHQQEALFLLPKGFELLDGLARPDRRITMRVALERFNVSRTTLKRAVVRGELRSYRKPGCPPNAEHVFSEADLDARYERR